ncbi:A disintegrin and metalloproteinase with thrombospondin motifs adt-2 [Hylaeus anthracinus]|uniref:A disintegrin and metalloproteinase with thrombospondin motifs adt-2 n=1 Tax=Hylaeus anthracinus TaxID=313031 RepID=UPI0023BA17D0|nr:A disintegrin and metalloproteinase with thrombospondin motifs adt-2 [Hylaeus anthracinus]
MQCLYMHAHAYIRGTVYDFSKYLNLKFKARSMSFVLEIVLLILLGVVYGWSIEDTEIVLLPLWNTEDNVEVSLSFKAFDRSVELTLRRNDNIVASQFQVWKHINEDNVEELPELGKPAPCHYLHTNELSSAAISLCKEGGMHGFVFLDNVTLEIRPLRDQKMFFFNDHHRVRQRSKFFGEPHIVKRAHTSPMFFENEPKWYEHNEITNYKTDHLTRDVLDELIVRPNNSNDALTLELAVFFDEPGYNLFSTFFERNDERIRDMLLAYINGVQAVYHHPTLGVVIDISLVRLEIMQRQPRDLPHFDGERGSLLDSFCNYAKKRNPSDETDPNHWDMGLYVSGLDFYAVEAGRKNTATMGLATVGGLCIDRYSCVIVELGVTNQFGKPFPSAGFTSVYIAAHEIGHNLGMHHDSTGNPCPRDGYIMSPSRGTDGETIWSECSRDVAQRLSYTKPCLTDRPSPQTNNRLDHTRFFDLPGREWNAKKQCEVLLRDKDASVATLYRSCKSLQCKTPHRSGYYLAGPALDGTYCAVGKECRGGECKNALKIPTETDRPLVETVGWSDWKLGPCSSGCLLKSVGAQVRRRFCGSPIPENPDAGCRGSAYDVVLCRDDRLCKKKRRSINEFATLRCKEFSERLPELDGKGGGLQALHEPERPWMSCAIFCRRKDIASYYTPRVELNDLGLDPYFPDGTWCHAEEGQNYFCRQHHCLPENFRFEKTLSKDRQQDDIEFGPQNAHPNGLRLDDQVVKYHSLGPDGLPLLTSLLSRSSIGLPPDENEWIDKDYIELTELPQEILFDL